MFRKLLVVALLTGCASAAEGTQEGSGGVATGSQGEASAPASGGGAGSGGTATAGCVPGASTACVGPAGCRGGQVCAADGRSFGKCECAAQVPQADAGPPNTTAEWKWYCEPDVNSGNCACVQSDRVPDPAKHYTSSCTGPMYSGCCAQFTEPMGGDAACHCWPPSTVGATGTVGLVVTCADFLSVRKLVMQATCP